jgi:hypothetical protein
MDQPVHSVRPTILTRELVRLIREFFTREHPRVDVAPTLRNFGKHLVMRLANKLCVSSEAEIDNVSPRDREIAHLAVEHGNRRRRVLDEHCQLRLFCEVRFSALAFADVDKHVDGTGQSSGCIEQRRRIGDKGKPRAIRAFGYCFHATNRSPLTQRQSHRALVVSSGVPSGQ